jgi:stress-induced morphogen
MTRCRFARLIAFDGVAAATRRGEPRRYDRPVATHPLQALLERAFPDATELSVEDRTGGGDHFQVIVRSPRFNGLPLLEQHRLVNAALAEPLRDGTIHELRIKTGGTE